MARRTALVALALVAATVPAGCRDDHVDVRFRPEVGQTFRYRTEIDSVTTTRIEGEPTRRSRTSTVFEATHTVIETGEGGVRVNVVLDQAGRPTRTYIVRYDAAARPVAVERSEGIPTTALGDLGLTEIFPSAAAAPPARSLAPGDTWTFADPVTLPGGDSPVTLSGSGRLVELRVRGSRKTATLATRASLPYAARVSGDNGTQVLDGRQRIRHRTVQDLDGGIVIEASTVTDGSFSLELLPPDGTLAEPLDGRLVVQIRSRTTRID